MVSKIGLFIVTILSVLASSVPQPSAAAGRARAAKAGQPSASSMRLMNKSSGEIVDLAGKLMRAGNADSALFCYELVNNRGMADDSVTYARSLHQAGVIYYKRYGYSKAMERYMSSLQICERTHNDRELSTLYKDIGNIYSMFGDYSQSSVLYQKSLCLARKLGDKSLANMMLNNLIFAYNDKTPISQYREWCREMASHHEARPRYGYDLLMTRGQVYIYERKPRIAIGLFRQAVAYCKSHKLDLLSFASAYGLLADLYEQTGKRDSALVYLHLNQQIAHKTGNASLLISTLRSLSGVYAKTDQAKSLSYKQEYLMLSDSIYNINEFNGIRNALYFHEMDKQLREVDRLYSTNESQLATISSQRGMLIVLLVCLAVFVVLLVIIIRQKRQLKEAFDSLFDKSQHDIITKNAYAQTINNLEEKVDRLRKKLAESTRGDAAPQSSPLPAATLSMVDTSDRGGGRLSEGLQDELLTAILHVMENTEAYCDSDFGIEKLATLIGTNSRYVSQVINDVYKENFRSFLNSYRVKKAMARMVDEEHYGNYTIRAIAESVGYKSQANFINVFTKLTGIKPSVFQKMSVERRSNVSTNLEEKTA